MKKVYYSLSFEQSSPVRIGNGRHEESDSDLMLDGRGLPFIPGTSLAGIIRHQALSMGMSQETENRLFGTVLPSLKPGGDPIIEKSAVIFGDAVLDKTITKDDIVFGRRDGVGLNDWGTAKKTSKFDFQIAESGCSFYSIIEWTGNDEQYDTEIDGIIEPILKHYVADGIMVGARTSRGYGEFKLSVKRRLFDFPKDLNDWINAFNPYDRESFKDSFELTGELKGLDTVLEIKFRATSQYSVRVNTARTELAEDGSVPDSVPMENHKGNPVVPGTAWAGAFRHHMRALLRDTGISEDSDEMLKVDELFGIAPGSGSIGKSKLGFSETELLIKDKAAQKSSVMRTAIDRFTAAPSNTALFTNMVYSGGEGTLKITYRKNSIDYRYLELLAACICDLHLGLITLGGEASVGRGTMQVISVKANGNDKTEGMKSTIDKGGALNWLKEDDKNE
ncbi:MAG: hypothetical protein K6G87_15200 [Butyrivibrio sp.]|uniref:RAMP superfamily CRISPR-associated protein n=1 Tax=Butyrivibrio sp. TaxID=28121 RepID=UPI0025DE134E|nr:RAMP superfamily CRISPR-associated protein [Butyrivibrio sp.]MCR5772564.1 hypothetical protein [Butyrivibrio sp.]